MLSINRCPFCNRNKSTYVLRHTPPFQVIESSAYFFLLSYSKFVACDLDELAHDLVG